MKILAIGNSFSQDATRYLYGIARADGFALRVVNLYIGGCSLARHYRNMLSGERSYELEVNGCPSGFCVSLDDALHADTYDVVTIQQVSHEAPDYETYQPYLRALCEKIRLAQPKAKLYLHQTWAYEEGSARLCEELKFRSSEEMMGRVRAAYAQAAADSGAELIPGGEAMAALATLGIRPHRDTFHAGYGVGRYTLGLVWYGRLTGRAFDQNRYRDFDCPVSEEEVALAKQAAAKALAQ